MKWEHKIGIVITCTFLCLIGAVIGLKLQEPPPKSSEGAAVDPVESASLKPETKIPIPDDNLDTNPLAPPLAPPDKPSGDAPRCDPPSGNSSKDGAKHDSPTPAVDKKDKKETTSSGKNGATKDSPTVFAPSGTPPLPGEPPPTLQPVSGADEWGKFSSGPKEKKEKATPATPPIGKSTVSPTLSPSPETKKQPPGKSSVSTIDIMPTGALEIPKTPPDSQGKQVPAPPTPPASPSLGSGTVPPPPPPPAAANSTNSTAPSMMAMPPYFSQSSTNSAKTPNPKEKGTAPLSPVPAPMNTPEIVMPSAAPDPKGKGSTLPPASAQPPVKAPEMLPLTPPTQTPTSPVAPPIVAPMPIPPAPLPTPTSPPPSPPPMQAPNLVPGPTSTQPAPISPAAPPSPPKPPSEGSSFVPDRSSSASGPGGVMPAPLPFPVPPPSSPLAATPGKSAPPPLAATPEKPVPSRPASTGASVMVYDEQDYSCRPGDTWEGVSKQFYMTDRYAKALQRHNQSHARASERMRDNGQLAGGERIFVPQAYVLEERYADAIAKPAAAPASTTMPATFVAPNGSPPPPKP